MPFTRKGAVVESATFQHQYKILIPYKNLIYSVQMKNWAVNLEETLLNKPETCTNFLSTLFLIS